MPQYRYLLAADDELDDAERSCAWQEDEDRNRLLQDREEQKATEAACESRRRPQLVRGPTFATSESEGR